jgi:hypothetical protein
VKQHQRVTIILTRNVNIGGRTIHFCNAGGFARRAEDQDAPMADLWTLTAASAVAAE